MGEIKDFPSVSSAASNLAAIFGALYPVPRSVASGALPLPLAPLDLDLVAYATASAKAVAAVAARAPLVLSSRENRAMFVALAARATYVRHGGALPWVPNCWGDVRKAAGVVGAGPVAMPDPRGGAIVLDPEGFIPARFGATDRATLSIARGAIRDIAASSETPIPGAIGFPPGGPVDVTGPNQLGVAPISPTVILLAGAGVALGAYGIYKWAEASENDSANRWFYTTKSAERLALADASLQAFQARVTAAAANGGKLPDPTPLEQAAAAAIGGSKEPGQYTGPMLAIGFSALTAALIYLGSRLAT